MIYLPIRRLRTVKLLSKRKANLVIVLPPMASLPWKAMLPVSPSAAQPPVSLSSLPTIYALHNRTRRQGTRS